MDDRNDSLIENNEQQNEENIFPDYDTQSELSLEMSEDHFSIDDSNQLDGSGLSNKYHLEVAIAKLIKQLRMESCNETKRNLVAKICELRIHLNEINEINQQQNMHVFGHKFINSDHYKNSSYLMCDVCIKKPRLSLKIIPGIKNRNTLLVCQFCNYQVHEKCQSKITRKCPKLIFEQSKFKQASDSVILKICPEVGLSAQKFQCADCKTQILNTISRICDYDGRYYCERCHWGEDQAIIPARVIHNWDFNPRQVSRQNLQIISYIKNQSILFNISELNSMLYGLVEELVNLKKIRIELAHMMRYIRICKQPNKPKLSISSYLMDEEAVNCYSINDLINLQTVNKVLLDAHELLIKHITKDCEGCRGKGFFCEFCRDKDDILFSFLITSVNCSKCSAVYHKNCYFRKGKKCPRCERLQAKYELAQKVNEQQNSNVSE